MYICISYTDEIEAYLPEGLELLILANNAFLSSL